MGAAISVLLALITKMYLVDLRSRRRGLRARVYLAPSGIDEWGLLWNNSLASSSKIKGHRGLIFATS